jgi:hypothetical protein
MLRETFSPEALARLYDQILSRTRPAILAGMAQPLTAEALAALLLPLPPEIADVISMAAWVPSARPSFVDLGSRWDVLATAPEQTVPANALPSRPETRTMVERLLTGEERPPTAARSRPVSVAPTAAMPAPSPRKILPNPQFTLDLSVPPPDLPAVIHELYRFGRAADRRWLSPDVLRRAGPMRQFTAQQAAARILCDWVHEVRGQRPPHADEKQWEVKVDLLRSAALILVPDASILDQVGRPGSDGRVPLLLYALNLEQHQAETLSRFGRHALRDICHQSLTCGGSTKWNGKVRQWLQNCEQSARPEIRAAIADAFQSIRQLKPVPEPFL